MRFQVNTEALDLHPDETPMYSRYFDENHDHVESHYRYTSLAMLNKVYLLLPDYMRVVINSFLVESISVVKVDSCPDEPVVFFPSMHLIVKPHVRGDGLFELRKVEVEGSYKP